MNKDEWLSVCGDMVHRLDRDRLMCATVAPVDKRDALLSLLAFNLEIATIPELVSEPLLGEIRLQWWRDALAALYAGKEIEHPVALGLAEAIESYNLSKSLFDEYLDARGFDMQGEAPASLKALENYALGTSGALNELMAEVLGLSSIALEFQDQVRAAVRQSGAAWALSGILHAVHFHAKQGRSYMPVDLKEGERIRAVAEAADRYIAQARSTRSLVPKSMQPVMLPVVLAEHRLGVLARCAFDPHNARLRRPGLGRLIGFYRKVLTKSY